MSDKDRLGAWQRWLRHPQRLPVRRAVFQVHLWCGIGLGLYIFLISVTGSVLVYRNELYAAVTPEPIISQGTGPRLSDEALGDAAMRAYPSYRVTRIVRARNPDQAVEIWMRRGEAIERRLFDPRTGADVGTASGIGVRLVSALIDLHADLLAGPAGRSVNAIGALAVLVSATTGLVVWWPGIRRWRRSLTLRRGVGWKRLSWDLHSAVGIWSAAFILVFAVSGLYLSIPMAFHELANRLQPPTEANAGLRFVDSALSGLAYSHFGRINGIGLPCSGPGLCDQATKAVWAVFGLAPASMITTGAIMWWNRVVQPRRKRARSRRTETSAAG